MVELTHDEYTELMKNQKPKNIIKRLDLSLSPSEKEGLRVGIKSNGKPYSVREHRGSWIMPVVWKKFYDNLKGKKAIKTFDALINTGARINEIRHIEERDIDEERNTLTLRVTKTKARKGETKGKPRTIPISSAFAKRLRKYFREMPTGSKLGILSTPGANMALKKGLVNVGIDDPYMYSIHNVRKSHGNYLKILGNLGIMKVDAMEICLRLGHDYNTFLSNYGSSGVMSSEDVQTAKMILGDLYS